MTQQTIEIEGLPEGWKAVAYRVGNKGESFIGDDDEICELLGDSKDIKVLIVEKIQPHRIVLEDTEEDCKTHVQTFLIDDKDIVIYGAHKVLNVVKE